MLERKWKYVDAEELSFINFITPSCIPNSGNLESYFFLNNFAIKFCHSFEKNSS